MMRMFVLASALSLTALPALAQEDAPSEGADLLEKGARMLLRGLMTEMEPAMRDLAEGLTEIQPQMREFADEMGPALKDLGVFLGDLNAYHPPERLPNGDIIIRRKSPMERAEDGAGDGQIDL